MRIHRFLKESSVLLSLKTIALYPDDPNPPESELRRVQEGVIGEFADIFERQKQVSNPKKAREDLLARELRTSTAIGQGIAFPHVRTQQARGFAIAIGRSPEGLPFGAPDNKLVHVFIGMIAPPHDDKFFLKIEQTLAKSFAYSTELYDAILAAESESEIIRAFAQVV